MPEQRATHIVRPLAELRAAHLGRPATVIGGGMSGPAQVARAPEGSVFISANQHGLFIRACDYIAAVDVWFNRVFKCPDGSVRAMRDLGVPIISPRRNDADYMVFDRPTNNAGVLGAWAAWVMGCAPILLAGMDCYQGGTYHHDPKAKSSGVAVPLQQHLMRWRRLIEIAPGAAFRTLGGPLEAVFPAYDPAEAVAPPDLPEAIPGTVGIPVRTTRQWRLQQRDFPAGARIYVTRAELVQGQRERAIERLAA